MVEYKCYLSERVFFMLKNDAQPSRLPWADILKFLGIFSIVWGHTLSSGAVRQYLYSFHVPLFFFVIGLYFKAPTMSFGRFFKKKTISLLVPYFSFAVISILIFSVLGKLASTSLDADVADFSLRTNLLEMLIGQCRANRPLWFLPSIFVFYILCFGLIKLTEKLPKHIRTATYLLVILGSAVLCALNSNTIRIVALFWKIDVSVFMLSFFLIAILLKPLFLRCATNRTSFLLSILLLLLGGFLAFRNGEVDYLSNNYGNVLLFYFSSICTVVGFCFISMFISHRNIRILNKTLTYVGQRTLPILLMHKFPILFFQVLFPWTKQPLKNSDPYVGFAVAIVSIAGCLFVELIWQKLFGMVISKIHKNKQATK